MKKYIFLDNWVYSSFTDEKRSKLLQSFIKKNHYTVILTVASMVELYNPHWQNYANQDRVYYSIQFLRKLPCVIVHPPNIWNAEIANFLSPINEFPIEIDLYEIKESLRASTLLKFLRRDPIFINQGKDIEQWRNNLKQVKSTWLEDVKNIINHACEIKNLKKDSTGKLIELNKYKEKFLFSLDFRNASVENINCILKKMFEITAVRLRYII